MTLAAYAEPFARTATGALGLGGLGGLGLGALRRAARRGVARTAAGTHAGRTAGCGAAGGTRAWTVTSVSPLHLAKAASFTKVRVEGRLTDLMLSNSSPTASQSGFQLMPLLFSSLVEPPQMREEPEPPEVVQVM